MQEKIKERVRAPYHFTQNEVHKLGSKLARLHNDMEVAKEARKATFQEEAKKINGISLDISITSRGIRDGYEIRDYDCYLEFDYQAKERVWRDIHTAEVRKREPFTADDYQRTFA